MRNMTTNQELLREIRLLRRRVDRLSRELEALKARSLEDPTLVEHLLKVRGLQVFRCNPSERLFFPSDLTPLQRDRFYELMKRYSFRLVLRDIMKCSESFRPRDLTHYCSENVCRRYCDALFEMGVIVKEGRGKYRVQTTHPANFGPTLEWFVAEMFKREFASSALYGIKLRDTPTGGDYDVIASWNGKLVYVEVKSSPPRGIELNEIHTFFSRLDTLLPDVAILFNDTQLRMKDKLVVMFEEALARRHGEDPSETPRVERLVEELFHMDHRIYIVNSRKDVLQNFRLCLHDALKKQNSLYPLRGSSRMGAENAKPSPQGIGEKP